MLGLIKGNGYPLKGAGVDWADAGKSAPARFCLGVDFC